jgi:two-component system chemotaxis response regulator CheY
MSYNILIVDDSATTRAVIRRTLQMADVPVQRFFEAPNGRLAVETLQSVKVDIMFLDLNMPEMTGIEVCRSIKADPDICGVPIVVVSSESLQSRIEQLKQEGVRGYVKKPFTPEQIRDVVATILPLGAKDAA